MATIQDFRNFTQFDENNISASGRYVGRNVYWKFYATENLYRILIHSILSVQLLPPDWWPQAVDQAIKDRATRYRADYSSRPWHTIPGNHDMYYIGLRDLNEIVRANAEKIRAVILNIDDIMASIEMICLPRNVVAHMNFLGSTDKRRVDTIYDDMKAVIRMVQQSNIVLQIPQ